MIRYIKDGNIFHSTADALVNPVNCRGTMGKGIALEFKKLFPECYPPYKQACDERKLKPGILMLVRLTVKPDDFWEKRPAVILFPTKNHWRGKSKIEWIEQGLAYIKRYWRQWGLKSIAMPQIGCGFGGLKWGEVKPLIERYLREEPIEVEVYLDNSLEQGMYKHFVDSKLTSQH